MAHHLQTACTFLLSHFLTQRKSFGEQLRTSTLFKEETLLLFKEETTWAQDCRASLMTVMGQGAKDTLSDGQSQNPKQNIVHFTGCGLKPESDRTLERICQKGRMVATL